MTQGESIPFPGQRGFYISWRSPLKIQDLLGCIFADLRRIPRNSHTSDPWRWSDEEGLDIFIVGDIDDYINTCNVLHKHNEYGHSYPTRVQLKDHSDCVPLYIRSVTSRCPDLWLVSIILFRLIEADIFSSTKLFQLPPGFSITIKEKRIQTRTLTHIAAPWAARPTKKGCKIHRQFIYLAEEMLLFHSTRSRTDRIKLKKPEPLSMNRHIANRLWDNSSVMTSAERDKYWGESDEGSPIWHSQYLIFGTWHCTMDTASLAVKRYIQDEMLHW